MSKSKMIDNYGSIKMKWEVEPTLISAEAQGNLRDAMWLVQVTAQLFFDGDVQYTFYGRRNTKAGKPDMRSVEPIYPRSEDQAAILVSAGIEPGIGPFIRHFTFDPVNPPEGE